jgi:hypothetical protein
VPIKDDVRSEASEIEAHAGERAQECRVAARHWRRLNVALGAPAAIIAGVTAGGFAVADHTTAAGSLAFVAAGLAALASFLRSGQLAEALARAFSSYSALRNDARLFREIESQSLADERLLAAIHALASRRNQIDATTPPTDRWLPQVRTVHVLGAVALLALGGGGGWLVAQIGGEGEENGEIEGAFLEVPRPSDETLPNEAELAVRFAPVLRLSTDERFFPLDRRLFVGRADLIRKSPKTKAEKLTDFPRTIEALPVETKCPTSEACRYFLHIPGTLIDVPRGKRSKAPAGFEAMQRGFFRDGDTSLVYWHVVRYENGEAAVQYWLFYVFNDFQNWHEGDWENITVRLDEEEEPTEVFYSAHEGGGTRAWDRAFRVGEHPIVYVARGSHANYFRLGKHRVTVHCGGKALKRGGCKVLVRTVRDRATGCGRLIQPTGMVPLTAVVKASCSKRKLKLQRPSLRYELEKLAGPRFVGFYGFGNFLFGGAKPAGEEGPREPTIRGEWENPLLEVVSGRTRIARA